MTLLLNRYAFERERKNTLKVVYWSLKNYEKRRDDTWMNKEYHYN
jgi:hypothetical protein